MQVILLEEIQNLGDLGDEVRVKPGYARNFLIPQGKAMRATAAARAEIEARRAELETIAAQSLAAAQARAQTLDGATLQITRKVGEEGKLFGSVSPTDIEDAATEAGLELAKSEIHLAEGPLKTVGDHEIPVSLHPEVHIKIIISIIGEA